MYKYDIADDEEYKNQISEILIHLLTICCTCLSVLGVFAGASVCRDIQTKRSTQNYGITPILTAQIYNLIWFYYGLLKLDWTIMISHTIGCTVQTFYIIVFIQYSNPSPLSQICGAWIILFVGWFHLNIIIGSRDAVISRLGLVGAMSLALNYLASFIDFITLECTKRQKFSKRLYAAGMYNSESNFNNFENFGSLSKQPSFDQTTLTMFGATLEFNNRVKSKLNLPRASLSKFKINENNLSDNTVNSSLEDSDFDVKYINSDQFLEFGPIKSINEKLVNLKAQLLDKTARKNSKDGGIKYVTSTHLSQKRCKNVNSTNEKCSNDLNIYPYIIYLIDNISKFAIIIISYIITNMTLFLTIVWEKTMNVVPISSTLLWTIYGYIMEDNFILTPYFIGLLCETVKISWVISDSKIIFILLMKCTRTTLLYVYKLRETFFIQKKSNKIRKRRVQKCLVNRNFNDVEINERSLSL